MSTSVKICGITNLDDARFCASAGADYLGFIQVPGSPRFTEPARVREICDWVEGARSVGVFADATPDDVARAADAAGFDMIQLHGEEDPADFEKIGVPLIKAVPVTSVAAAHDIAESVRRLQSASDFVLFDTATDGRTGGTGRSFDWSILEDIAITLPFFVAGGLGPPNVGEAVRRLRPFGVDASSGLESRPGIKDFELVEKFFAAIRAEDMLYTES